MDIPILYEDDALWVVDKPAGVVVNRAETVGLPTIQDWAERNLKAQNHNSKLKTTTQSSRPRLDSVEDGSNLHKLWERRRGVVHRLDKETSGCLIIARAPSALIALQQEFKTRRVSKEYISLVHGNVEPNRGAIRVPLSRSRLDRRKFAVSPGGREAETEYEVIWLYQGKYTLLRLYPVTGRTHQIRVHLTYFGHPIVADDKYAGEDRAKADRQWCPRLFLHARAVKFNHPVTHRQIVVTSPLPADLQSVLDNL